MPQHGQGLMDDKERQGSLEEQEDVGPAVR
jgi:hypothetical protein